MIDGDPETTALYREVDDDLRQERMDRLWKKYASVFAGGAIALVVSVGIYEGWHSWESSRRENEAIQYTNAVIRLDHDAKDQNHEAAKALATLATEGATNYRTMAALRRADLTAANSNVSDAVAQYRGIASDSNALPVYREAALILAVLHDLDRGDPKALEAELQSLTSASSSWRFSALELSAFLAQKQGNDARARDMLSRLADDPETPAGIRTRVTQLLVGIPAAEKSAASAAKKG